MAKASGWVERLVCACFASYGGVKSADLASPAEAGFAKAGAERDRQVVGDMLDAPRPPLPVTAGTTSAERLAWTASISKIPPTSASLPWLQDLSIFADRLRFYHAAPKENGGRQ